jgi:hypothetical protein
MADGDILSLIISILDEKYEEKEYKKDNFFTQHP